MSRRRLGDAAALTWRFRGTILIQAVIITVGLLTRGQSPADHHQLLHRIGMDYRALSDGRLWHLLTGTWFQSDPGIAISMVLLVFSGTVVLEYLAGTANMLLTVVLGDWIATILTLLTLRAWSGMGSATATRLLEAPDSGSSALAHAGLAAAAVLLPQRWRVVAVPTVVVFTLAQFWIESPTPAIAHAWAALIGVLASWWMLCRK